MSYDFSEIEPKIMKFWDKEEVFKFDVNDERPVYSVDTPPPTVSGKIHIGHIFSYTQAEVMIRYKRMQGFNVFYPFGFDDNGLPTERLVERDLDIVARDTDRQEFVKSCLEVTEKYRNKFVDLWKSVGLSADWSLVYSTVSEKSQRISQKSFLELLKEGKVVKKDTPALWCPECQTSVAQAEVDDKEMDSFFHDINFKFEDGSVLVIATTRPELLPACVAVFVHPDDARYKDLHGKKVKTPFGLEVPLLADEDVAIDKGTGAVMCCTYGDEMDMRWVEKHGLEPRVILAKDGQIFDEELGKSYPAAVYRKIIVKRLVAQGDLVDSKKIVHAVGVHERCGTAMEILPVPQWFITVMDKKKEILKKAEEINFYPAYMKTRFVDWVNNLKWDWCVSRQRFFGVPVPVWYSKKTGEMILPDYSELPVDPQLEAPAHLPEGHTKDDIIADTDILDTWATSSLSPELNARWLEEDSIADKILPMALRPQAHDIIRTWTFYTVVKSLLHHDDIPWKDVMISGHVLAGKGEKISKSKGNQKSTPEEIIEKYSADAVRYWACGASLGRDTAFEEKEIKNGKRLVMKLWNATRFAFMNMEGFDPSKDFDISKLENIDKWIIERVHETYGRMQKYLESYEIGHARNEFEKFFWQDLCSYYLELIKGRIYQFEEKGYSADSNEAAQYTLYWVMNEVMKLIAPYLPFVTEEIYQTYYKDVDDKKSVHLCQQGESLIKLDVDQSDLRFEINLVKEIVDYIRQYKTQNGISLGANLALVEINSSAKNKKILENYAKDISSVVKAQDLKIIESALDELKIDIRS